MTHTLVNMVQAASNSKTEVVELWRKYLGPTANLQADFIAEGGDSLTAVRLLRDIENRFNMDFDLSKLTDGITIERLIAQIEGNRAGTGMDTGSNLHLVDAGSVVPDACTTEDGGGRARPMGNAMPARPSLSSAVRESGSTHAAPMQRAYWIGEKGGLDSSAPAVYMMELQVAMLDPAQLQQAVETVVARHEILRLRIDEVGMLQADTEYRVPELAFLDCTAKGADAERELQAFREAMAGVRFGFDGASFAIGLARAGAQSHLFLTLPLWRFDAASTQRLIQELLALATAKGDTKLAEPADFTTYARQWHKRRTVTQYERDRSYWLERLGRLPAAPGLPQVKRGNPTTEDTASYLRHIHAELSQQTWSRLQAQAAKRSLTVASVGLAAFACALARISGSEHFTLTCLISARDSFDERAADCLGNFGETLCLEVDRREQADFESNAMLLQRQLWRDRTHMNFSGTDVAAAWRRQHGYSDGPTFPVTFTLAKDIAGDAADIVASSGRLSVPQVHLDHQILEHRNGAILNIDYREGIYTPGVPEEILASYHAALVALAESDIAWAEIFPGRKGNWPEAPAMGLLTRPGERLEDGFLRNVTEQPDQLAVITEEASLTYRELFLQALHLAERLRAEGGQSGDRIAIHTEKGWREIVAVIGVMLADMVYVPMHPSLPILRKKTILQSSGAQLILSSAGPESDAVLGKALEGARILVLDGGRAPGEDPTAISPRSSERAYILYTSGTTGTPKGVAMSHRAALNTIRDLLDRYAIGPTDRCLGLSQLSFDLSVFDIFGMLAAGGALVLPSGADERNPPAWLDMCHLHGVTLWNSVPALMQLAIDSATDCAFRRLRLVFLSGDWVPSHLPSRIRQIRPEAHIVAMGGATEAAIWSILHDVEDSGSETATIPYGRAMREQAVYVLDRNGRQCLPFEPSEIFIAGMGLAEGYWGDEAKTGASFIYHPYSGMRLYATGDLGRYWPDGTIEFLGRRDSQVKIQGYRVECGEVEAALIASAMVEDAVVIGADEPRGKALHAYVVTLPGMALDRDGLMHKLSARLPAYMVPTRLFEVARLPLTSNGKVDRRALLGLGARDLLAIDEASGRQEARNDLEKKLAGEWAKLLEIPEPGIDDDFFALGGTSFTGMMLMARLSRMFEGRRLTLAHLTSCPTIRKLGAMLDSAQTDDGTCLRPVGGCKGAQALVLLPPIGGNSACYSELISLLAPSFHIHAVTARGLDGEQMPFRSIPEMGQAYARMIAAALPDEKPLLVGWSMGGLVAIEVARALGDRQAGIVAIDSRLAACGGDGRQADDRAAFLEDIRLANGDAGAMSRLLDCDPDSTPEAAFAVAAARVFSAHRQALESYVPLPVAARATLMVAAHAPGRETGLETIFAQVERIVLDADHYTILRGATLASIAKQCRHIVAAPKAGARGMQRLQAILQQVRPGFDEVLTSADVIGQELGFSSIEQIRIIGLIEDALDIDLMADGLHALNVGALCAMLEKES